MADCKVKNASFFLTFFFKFVPLVSICTFSIAIFLIDVVALLINFGIIFFIHSLFDFRKHEIAVDRPDALDKKLRVKNFG